MSREIVVEYGRGALSPKRLQKEIDGALKELSAEDAAALRHVTVGQDEQAFDPILVTIIITIVTNVGTDEVQAAFGRLVRRIKDTIGEDAVGEERKPADESEKPQE